MHFSPATYKISRLRQFKVMVRFDFAFGWNQTQNIRKPTKWENTNKFTSEIIRGVLKLRPKCLDREIENLRWIAFSSDALSSFKPRLGAAFYNNNPV